MAFERMPCVPHRAAPRCLVVDDDRFSREVLVQPLRALAFEVDQCDSVRAAHEYLGQAVYAQVFLDCVLPDGDGRSIARAIRAREASRETERMADPGGGATTWIVGMSASRGMGVRQSGRAAGMDVMLAKPLTAAAIRQAIGAQPGMGVAEVAEVAQRGRVAGVDRAIDPGVEAQVLSTLQAACRQDATALQAAIAENDRRQMRYLAHRLRGMALLAGHRAMAEDAALIEQAHSPSSRNVAPALRRITMRLHMLAAVPSVPSVSPTPR